MGILGISERLGVLSSFEKKTSEREGYIHLYNTYSNERKFTYQRYYVSSTERKTEIKRPYIYSDRKFIFTSYQTLVNERQGTNKAPYVVHTDERKFTYERWFTTNNERKFTLLDVDYFNSERKFLFEGKYLTERRVFLKHYFGTERKSLTYGVKPIPIANSRKFIVQDTSHLVSIRKSIVPITSFKFTLNINPFLNNLDGKVFEVNPILNNPYESGKNPLQVIDEELEFRIFFVRDLLPKGDLNLVYWDNTLNDYRLDVISDISNRTYLLTKISNTTYLFKFFLIPTRDNLTLRITPPLVSLSPIDYENEFNLEVLEWIKYQKDRYGLLNVKVNSKEYDFSQNLIFYDSVYDLIQVEFYITKEFFNRFYETFGVKYPELVNPNFVVFRLYYTFIDITQNEPMNLNMSTFDMWLYRS